MKASEAMRLGAMVSGQAFGVLEDEGGNTCAMGAVRAAVGLPTRHLEYWHLVASQVELYQRFPILGTPAPALCPACSVPIVADRNLGDLLVHLNNDDRWTRERIADLVQEYESRQEQRAAIAESSPVADEELVGTL